MKSRFLSYGAGMQTFALLAMACEVAGYCGV